TAAGEDEVPGQVADPAADLDAVGARVAAQDEDLARGAADEVEQDADGGRLARAVGAEEAEDLAGADPQVQAEQGPAAAVVLGEAAGFDDGVRGCVHGGLPFP